MLVSIRSLMKFIFLTFGLLVTIGCSPANRSPDAIRQNTANATAAAARDAKAVAQGVFEGLKAKGPLNINKATAEELETLPGVGTVTANRIISGRPYKNSIELLNRHLVTKQEYDRIANRIVAR
jgi:DNA uptake protein ComE-like DNA-binding protein